MAKLFLQFSSHQIGIKMVSFFNCGSVQNRSLGVLENQSSLTVKISKESDIKQRVKNLHLKLSEDGHSIKTAVQE